MSDIRTRISQSCLFLFQMSRVDVCPSKRKGWESGQKVMSKDSMRRGVRGRGEWGVRACLDLAG